VTGADIEDTYPLSPLQQGMLFHTLRDAGVGMYITQAVSRVDGLDPDALRRAWQRLLDRHPILRTSFDWSDPEQPVQHVHRQVDLPFVVHDWREHPPAEQRAMLAELLERERESGFRLDTPPLLRVTVCRVSGSRWQSINTHHHILLDGWSGGIVSAEVAKLYDAECLGETITLPPAIGFRRYIDWLQAQDLSQAERFWRRQLGDLDGPTPLPTDRWLELAHRLPSAAASWSAELDPALADGLEALARKLRITVNTLVQGAWGILLSRYSGRRTVLFGVLVSGRPPALQGVELIVGMFLNTLPFRVDVEPGQTLDRWLAGLREQQVELAQYEYSPLMRVQQWSSMPRGTALFDSIVARKDTTGTRRERESRGSRRDHGGRAQTTFQQNYALLLNLRVRDGIELKTTYDTARFDAPDVVRFMHQLTKILEAMVAAPEQRLADIPLMDAAERQRLLQDWNGDHVPVTELPPLPELLVRQAQATPNALALVDGEQHTSYRALVAEMRRVAQLLAMHELPPGALVALGLPRGATLISAMLGVLQARCCFTVVDLELPEARRRAVLDDAAPSAVLCSAAHAALFENVNPARVAPALIAIDGAPPGAPTVAAPAASIDDTVCVVYRGDANADEPCGVEVSQRAILSRWVAEPQPMHPGEAYCVLSPLDGLDAVLDLFSALASGAVLLIGPDASKGSTAEIQAAIASAAASRTALSAPSLRRLLDTAEDLAGLGTLSRLVCRVPAPQPDLAEQARQRLPGVDIALVLHSPETGDALCHELRDAQAGESMRLGRPLTNVAPRIIDSQGDLCPIGVPGELCIAGAGLAAGYWLRPERTAAAFAHGAADDAATPVFRTGQLARWLPDGGIEGLGAMDEQYFVAGRRFSPLSVAARLRQHAHVRAAAVTLDAEHGLAAHVVTDGADVSGDELRRLLTSRLPAALIPRSYHFWDRLPPARDDLAARVRAADASQASSMAAARPLTDLERKIAALWCEVLGVQTVGGDDNFFELGGHSLNATQVIVRLRLTLARPVSLRAIFEAPTLSGLAARIEAGDDVEAEQGPALTRRAHADAEIREAPQSFAQQRLWFLCQLAPGTALYNLPGAIPLNGACDVRALARALAELVRRHESLRTTFETRNGEPVQRVAPPTPVELPITDLKAWPRARRQQEVMRLRRVLSTKPFDLVRGPLLRAHLVLLAEQRQLLLFCMHHIITDGWSLNVLRRELDALYNAFRSGQPSPLPELPLQYADFALWQRDWLQGEVLRKQLDYWRRQLADLPRLDLPTDHPRPAVPRYASAYVAFELDADFTRRLGALARSEEATLFMAALAAFSYLLGSYGGQEDIAIGTPIANRSRPELEGLIGFFVNTLVLRADLAAAASFRELLRRARSTCLEAYANQDLPFEKLVEELAPKRDLSVQPLFQVLLVLQNTPMQTETGRRRVESQRGGNPDVAGLIYYDLTLSLRETAAGLAGALHYNTDIFDQITVERMVAQLTTLLGRVTEDPDHALTPDLLISPSEHSLLLAELQADTVARPRLCMHQLFEQTVDRRPHKAAVVFEGQLVTYAQLDAYANWIAALLIERGVEPDRLVGVYLERGPAVVVALLGILKAGAAYLPMDTALPRERVAMILDDARPLVVLTTAPLAPALELDGAAAQVVRLPDRLDDFATARRPSVACSPHQLAYVIFTSGSTGRPKGVAVEHHSLCNTILGQIPIFGITAHSRVLATIAFTFDASLGELFRTLLAGATLFLTHRAALLPGPTLLRVLQEWRITTLTTVPSVLRALPTDAALPALETITVGGEELTADLADQWRGQRRLINGYGPTETAIGATLATTWEPARKPPIGRPLPNVKAYILSNNGSLLPVGASGELCLGGPGVARGYWQRPELTAAQFVGDPFAEHTSARLYRTGDRVRWAADGQLEFLGRMDDQVKLRGYRIEPGEIAATLRAHEAVADAVVVAKGHGSDRRLVAYAVPRSNKAGDADAAAALVDGWERASAVAAEAVNSRSGDPRLNFAGWTSSFDGQAIPPAEMCEWSDATVQRIRALSPRDVLEIGSGTGLILFRLAPFCRRYVGVDFARGLLDQAERHLSVLDGSDCKVELLHRRADELSDLHPQSFDCVVLNSVVQYFPNSDYLLRALEGAVRLVRPGGFLFLGDVRNLRMLETLHVSIQLHRAAATASTAGLLSRARRHMEIERELVLDPGLFMRLQRDWPRVTHVQVMPRSSTARNELVRYRYDVIMHVDGAEPRMPDCEWLHWNWRRAEDGLAVIRERLLQRPEALGVTDVVNARTVGDAQLLHALRQETAPSTVVEAREAISAADAAGVQPSFIAAVADETGYSSELSWLDCDEGGSYAVLFTRGKPTRPHLFPLGAAARSAALAEANAPAQVLEHKQLQLQFRDWLTTKLPDYMVPTDIVLLDQIPLTAHGKLDKKALPDPGVDGDQRAISAEFVAPRTQTEAQLADIWATLLRLPRVGIHDNFFELGGDSILSIQMIARAAQLGLHLTPQDVYQCQTIAEQAARAYAPRP